MLGCLSLPFRLLGLAIVAGLVYLGWTERGRIAAYWHQLTDRPAATAPGDTGRPGEAALQAATSKIDSLNGWRADSVVLTASEMASLIGAGLDRRVREDLDSLAVTLGEGRIEVAALIRTAGVPREVLGPLAGALADWEPITAAGTVQVTGPSRAEWRVDAFRARDFEFPREMVPRIVGLVAGQARDGALPILIPQGIGGVRVYPGGVTLYSSGSPP